jgi:hypothetical protein
VVSLGRVTLVVVGVIRLLLRGAVTPEDLYPLFDRGVP